MKLKRNSLPSTVASALAETSVDLFPNSFYMLSLLAVLPVSNCEAERTISALGRLKTSLRSTMGQAHLTGLALMHIHYDISIQVEKIVQKFPVDNPRRMKLSNPFSE